MLSVIVVCCSKKLPDCPTGRFSLTFDIVHFRRGDDWIIRTIRFAVLAFTLRVWVQNHTY